MLAGMPASLPALFLGLVEPSSAPGCPHVDERSFTCAPTRLMPCFRSRTMLGQSPKSPLTTACRSTCSSRAASHVTSHTVTLRAPCDARSSAKLPDPPSCWHSFSHQVSPSCLCWSVPGVSRAQRPLRFRRGRGKAVTCYLYPSMPCWLHNG